MNILDEIGLLEGTDKSSLTHDYLRHYDRVLSPWRDEPITLLEIGIADGGSMQMWERYFTRATIVGVDINPACRRHSGGRRVVEIGSQADAAFLADLGARYQPTIIIDDGSHQTDHIYLTFNTLFPHLRPRGLYIVEDVHFHAADQDARSPQRYFSRLAVALCCPASDAGHPSPEIDSIEFFHGCALVRKRASRENPIDLLRLIVQRANRAETWGAFAMLILRYNGDPAEAVQAARRAVEIAPATAGLYGHLSIALEAAGDIRRASEAAQEAARLDPGFAPFQAAAARLQRANETHHCNPIPST